MLARIMKLLKEPSTYAGIASTLGGLALFGLSTGQWDSILSLVMAAAGVVSAVVLDTKDKEDLDNEKAAKEQK